MKFPVSWLAEFVDVPSDPKQLASVLTGIGLKVESIEEPGREINGVAVAEVLAIQAHPDADRLTLVDLRTAEGDTRVVCGAKNFSVGDRVPLASPGAMLPGGFEIKKAKIRGQASNGMLCSARELGLGEDHSGILVLPPEAGIGTDVREVLGLNDAILELEITPNRPDEMSLIGVAREFAAATGASVRLPSPELSAVGAATGDVVTIEIEDLHGCPRYLGRVLTGVKVRPSPPLVQQRLVAAGMRPVSNVVDATNYALLITGHPMHAFDLDKLGGPKIIVRRARPEEKIVTLDGEDRTLDPDDLVIADASRAVAIAGVMGGLDTEVSDTTTSILLESAYFDPRRISRSSRRHGLHSEASSRYERGVDPNNVEPAADLVCSLLSEWAGAEVSSSAIDVYPQPIRPAIVKLRPERARKLIGVDYSDEEIASALNSLSLEPKREDGVLVVEAPTRRQDLRIEEDLIEEVVRLTGYDRVPATLPRSAGRAGGLTQMQRLVRGLKQTLVGAGLYEALTSTFVGSADIERLGTQPMSVPLVNPLTADESVLRPCLMLGLLLSARRNIARRNLDVRLFEVGEVFAPSGRELPNEKQRLGILLCGQTSAHWYEPSRSIDFFDLKGVIETLVDSLMIEDVTYRQVEMPPFHPARAASIYAGDRKIGTMGELEAGVQSRYDLPFRTYVAEIDLAGLLGSASPPAPAEAASRFPAVLLDLAVAVATDVQAGDVLSTARSAGGEHLEEVRLFDVYSGEQLGPGTKSLALALTFRAQDRTLTETEAIATRDAIAAALSAEFGAQVRGG